MLPSKRIKNVKFWGIYWRNRSCLNDFSHVYTGNINLDIIEEPSIESRSLKSRFGCGAARTFFCRIVVKCHVKYRALLNIHLTRINYILPRGCNPGSQREFLPTAPVSTRKDWIFQHGRKNYGSILVSHFSTRISTGTLYNVNNRNKISDRQSSIPKTHCKCLS